MSRRPKEKFLTLECPECHSRIDILEYLYKVAWCSRGKGMYHKKAVEMVVVGSVRLSA